MQLLQALGQCLRIGLYKLNPCHHLADMISQNYKIIRGEELPRKVTEEILKGGGQND